MFGLVQLANTQVTANVQVSGVFAAGTRSSAVLIVDGKPARAYLVGQQIAPGLTLAEVRQDGVTLESGGGEATGGGAGVGAGVAILAIQ